MSEESDGLYDVTDAAAQLDRIECGDVAPVHHDPSAVERHETVDGAQQRRFTAARRTEQHDELAAVQLERYAIDGIASGARIPNHNALKSNLCCVHDRFV